MPCCLSPTFWLLLDTPSWPCLSPVYLSFSSSRGREGFHLWTQTRQNFSPSITSMLSSHVSSLEDSIAGSHNKGPAQISWKSKQQCYHQTLQSFSEAWSWILVTGRCVSMTWHVGNVAWYFAHCTQYIVVVLNLKLILASLAIKARFRAAWKSPLLTDMNAWWDLTSRVVLQTFKCLLCAVPPVAVIWGRALARRSWQGWPHWGWWMLDSETRQSWFCISIPTAY